MKALLMSLIILLLWACYGKEPINTSLIGKKLPSFDILRKDSTVFSTQLIPTGRPVVLFYFTPHCPFCRAQFEDIRDNMQDLKNIQFYMLTPSPYQEMKAFYEQLKIDQYPNITMGTDTAAYFPNYFDVRNVPAIAIFNKEQKLNALFLGKTDVRQIKEVAEQ